METSMPQATGRTRSDAVDIAHASRPRSNDGARPAPSVLLIDDDAELRALMAEFLTQHDCRVSVAANGQDGLAQALSGEHDLVTLDVMLPVIDGFELLRQLRRRSRVPVIMLTARTSAEDRISGLEGGADDYLPKPFHAAELLARIRAVLRRAGFAHFGASDVAEAGGVAINAQSRQGWCHGVPLALTSVEFDILDLLVRSAGRVVSRDQLAAVLYQRQHRRTSAASMCTSAISARSFRRPAGI